MHIIFKKMKKIKNKDTEINQFTNKVNLWNHEQNNNNLQKRQN